MAAHKIAVLGFWHVHAADYAGAASRHPDTELVAVWDHDPVLGRAGAEQLGVEYVEDLDALLARPDLAGVTLTTETTSHRDIASRALRAGKHVFAEKLLAPTVAEAQALVDDAEAAGCALVVSLPRLYSGSTRAIIDVIADGALGRLTYCRVRLSHDGATAGWLPERFYDHKTAVGGALTDLGCHPVYLTQLFLGALPDQVSATYRSVTGRAVEDHAVVTLGYPDGALGVVEAGFVSSDPFTIELHGTEGSLRYTSDGNRLKASGAAFGGDGWGSLPVSADRPDAFSQWVGHIQHRTRAADNLSRAVELTRLVVAANEAARTGSTQSYPPAPTPS